MSSAAATAFDERVASREAKLGIDVDEDRVRAVREGRSYLVDVPATRYDRVDGRLRATTDYSAVETMYERSGVRVLESGVGTQMVRASNSSTRA